VVNITMRHSTRKQSRLPLKKQCPSELLPINKDAEADALACILLKPEIVSTVLDSGLCASDFHDPVNRDIFAGMLALHVTGKPPEPKLLTPWLKSHTTIEHPQGALIEIMRRQAIGTSGLHYAELALDTGIRRELHHLSESMQVAANNGKHVDAIISETRESFERIAARGKKNDLRPLLFGELADQNPKLQAPVVDGLLREGETANIVSGSKVGKSWLVYDLLLSIIMGQDFIGRFKCSPGRVLLIDNELHQSTIANRIQSVANAKGIRAEQYRMDLDVLSLRGRLLDLYAVLRLLERIEPGDYRAIVFDAWYRGYPVGVSENDNAQIMLLYNAVDAAACRLRCSWFNVHHSSKGQQGEKATVDVGAGAGSQSRCVDAHIIFRQHEEPDAVVLEAALRSFAPIEPLVLRWQFPLWRPDDSLDPAKLRGKLTASDQRQTERDGDGLSRLANAFKQGPATVRELRGRSGLSRQRCERLLDQLEAACSVRFSEVVKHGNRCRLYEAVNLDNLDDDKPAF
jgi:hypothetical protein